MSKLQPKDYAALSVATADLKQEIISSVNFKKLMRYGEIPGVTIDAVLKVSLRIEDTPPSEEFSLGFVMDASDLPVEEVQDNPDISY